MYSSPNFKQVHCSTSSSNCCVLTCIQVSQEAGKVVWYTHLFRSSPQFVVIHTVRASKWQRKRLTQMEPCHPPSGSTQEVHTDGGPCQRHFEKRKRNQRLNCQHPLDHRKNKSSRKTSISALLTMPKSLTVWIAVKCRKCLKRWEHQTTWPDFWEICIQVEKQQLEPDMEQQTGSNLGKEYDKAVYCHPAYWTYMQSASCEMLGWIKHKLQSRFLGEISLTSVVQMTPPLWQKEKGTKEALDERGEWKSWLETEHSKN